MRPKEDIEGRRHLFAERIAQGMPAKTAARTLSLNARRELARPDVKALIAHYRNFAIAEKLAQDSDSRALAPRGEAAVSKPPQPTPTPPPRCADCKVYTNLRDVDGATLCGYCEGRRKHPRCMVCGAATNLQTENGATRCHYCVARAAQESAIKELAATPGQDVQLAKEEYAARAREQMARQFASTLVSGVTHATETGTFTLDTGWKRDLTEADRADTIAKIKSARESAPRRSWLPGQTAETIQ